MYISDLLKKFKNITAPDIIIRNYIVDIVKEIINIKLDKKNIFVKNGIVYIKTKPIYKNEIFINKKKIINLLKEKVGDSVYIKDIR